MTDGDGQKPLVSIVVITKDRREDLYRALDSLARLDYPRDLLEVVVVEEGDEPGPPDGVEYVFLPRRDLGLGYARNAGVRRARGDVIAFTDDDCVVDPAWVRELVAGLDDPGIGGVAGATFAQEGSLIGACEDILGFPGGGHQRYHSAGGRPVDTQLLSTCNCAYRKDVLGPDPFKEDGFARLGSEDYFLGQRVAREAGCRYLPAAVVHHKPRASLWRIVSWFARRRIVDLLAAEAGDGRKRYAPLVRSPHRVALLRPVLALLVLVFGGWVGAALLLSAAAAWYGFMLARSYPVTQFFASRAVVFLVPVVRLFMDLGVMVGEWRYLTHNHARLGLTLDEYQR